MLIYLDWLFLFFDVLLVWIIIIIVINYDQ